MDWSDILSQILAILIPALATAIVGWFGVLGKRIQDKYSEKSNNKIRQEVVENVVKYVEQVYADLSGEEKIEKAMEEALQILTEKGISTSETELRMLIESAVYEMNKEKDAAENAAAALIKAQMSV
jgi:hypothetical protein